MYAPEASFRRVNRMFLHELDGSPIAVLTSVNTSGSGSVQTPATALLHDGVNVIDRMSTCSLALVPSDAFTISMYADTGAPTGKVAGQVGPDAPPTPAAAGVAPSTANTSTDLTTEPGVSVLERGSTTNSLQASTSGRPTLAEVIGRTRFTAPPV